MDLPPAAAVVWYAVGRFYAEDAPGGKVQDLGYFAHLGGIEPLFRGAPGEATAFFTFRSEPFSAQTVQNGDLSVGLDATGGFTLYFNREPCGDFSRPETFSRGEPIAVFRRLYTVAGTSVGPVGTNLFTAVRQSSRDFEHAGRTWNLERIIPHGITQLGTASTAALPAVKGYGKVSAFVGSAMTLGPA